MVVAGWCVIAGTMVIIQASAYPVGQVESQTRNCEIANQNVEVESNGRRYPHRLVISCLHKVIYIYPYPRGVTAIWAPKSDWLAINDYWASDVSRVVLLGFRREDDRYTAVRRTDFDSLFKAYVPNGRRLDLYGTRYEAATRWQSASDLAVTITAFGAQPLATDLKVCYSFSLPHSFVKMPISWCGESRALRFPAQGRLKRSRPS